MNEHTSEFGNEIRRNWLKENQRVRTWEGVKERRSIGGAYSEEQFWRAQQSPAHHGFSDEELFFKKMLVNVPSQGIFHTAYLPWEFPDGTPGKSTWSEEDWKNFEVALSAFIRENPIPIHQFSWSGLTLPSSIAKLFCNSPLESMYFFGPLSTSELQTTRVKNILIDGDASQLGSELQRFHVTGTVRYFNRSAEIRESKIQKLIITGKKNDPSENDLKILNSNINEIRISTDLDRMYVQDSPILSFLVLDSQISFIDIASKDLCELGLSFKGSVKNRATFRNLKFVDPAPPSSRGSPIASFSTNLI